MDAVQSGRVVSPQIVVVYGVPGVGKSTFAAGAPKPLFLAVERGTDHLDVARLTPESWDDILTAVAVLLREKHDYQTMVLDTADAAERLCWDAVSSDAGVPFGDIGYGRGYNSAFDRWCFLTARLEELRDQRGMTVVLVAHSKIHKFTNPAGSDYNRFTLNLHERAGAWLQARSDAFLFAQYEDVIVGGKETAGGDRTGGKVKTTRRRVLRTQYNGSWEAKCRPTIPDPIPLEWAAFDAARLKALDPSAARAEAVALIDRMPTGSPKEAKAKEAAMRYLEGLHDVAKIEALVSKLKEKEAEP